MAPFPTSAWPDQGSAMALLPLAAPAHQLLPPEGLSTIYPAQGGKILGTTDLEPLQRGIFYHSNQLYVQNPSFRLARHTMLPFAFHLRKGKSESEPFCNSSCVMKLQQEHHKIFMLNPTRTGAQRVPLDRCCSNAL